jgi:hypothetical protein
MSAYATYWMTFRLKGSMIPDLLVSAPLYPDEVKKREEEEEERWDEEEEDCDDAGEARDGGDGPS